jgi:hypothetical protein
MASRLVSKQGATAKNKNVKAVMKYPNGKWDWFVLAVYVSAFALSVGALLITVLILNGTLGSHSIVWPFVKEAIPSTQQVFNEHGFFLGTFLLLLSNLAGIFLIPLLIIISLRYVQNDQNSEKPRLIFMVKFILLALLEGYAFQSLLLKSLDLYNDITVMNFLLYYTPVMNAQQTLELMKWVSTPILVVTAGSSFSFRAFKYLKRSRQLPSKDCS